MNGSTLMIFDGTVPEQRALWCEVWQSWPGREVFAHPDYVRLFARPADRPMCAAMRTADGGVLFPFLLRPLSAETWADAREMACDVVSPYGYGGAYVWNSRDDAPGRFWHEFEEWCEARGVVSSFVRLALFPDQVIPFPGEVVVNALNVVRTLDIAPNDLWHEYEHKVRKNVNRARRSNLELEVDFTGKRLEDFLAIYYSTMDRRDAKDDYYFGRDFFQALVDNLCGQFVFFHVLSGQRMVATELVLVSAEHMYSFLGGTLAEFFALRPNDLLKHEIIRWGQQAGKRTFVLGGGYGGEDGIYRYKKSFAPAGVVPFQVGRRIHDAAGYRRLLARRQEREAAEGNVWRPRPSYFPEYRA